MNWAALSEFLEIKKFLEKERPELVKEWQTLPGPSEGGDFLNKNFPRKDGGRWDRIPIIGTAAYLEEHYSNAKA